MEKIIGKIERFFRIKRCYYCNRIIWWQEGQLRYIEDMKDQKGFIAPACKNCIEFAKNHQF